MVLLFLLDSPLVTVRSVAFVFQSVIFRILDAAPALKSMVHICILSISVKYLAHQRGGFNNPLNITESLDIKLKPGGDPALFPLGEIILNKPLQFSSWKLI